MHSTFRKGIDAAEMVYGQNVRLPSGFFVPSNLPDQTDFVTNLWQCISKIYS